MATPGDIETPRLILRSMRSDFYATCLAGDVEGAETLLGFRIHPAWFEQRELIAVGLENARTAPLYAPWGLRAVGVKKSGLMAGYLGFHTSPDPDYLRTVADRCIELAYVIFPEHRRRKIATEALLGLIHWAVATGEVASFAASIEENNLPSRLLVEGLGFMQAGMIDRDNDGHMLLLYILDDPILHDLIATSRHDF